MAYTVKSSERLRPSAADTETKAMLYLMNFREDSEEIFFFVVDFFNDLTSMSKMANKLWDLQSKGDKQPSPYIIGTELVTLYKNVVSEFEFTYYIIFLGGVSNSLRIDDKLTRFGIENIKSGALSKLKEDIVFALQKADISIYADSMQSLVYKDIQNSLTELEKP